MRRFDLAIHSAPDLVDEYSELVDLSQRMTPARLMPSSCVRCWMKRSRSMSASE
jgi:hypothetical protein